MEPEALCRQLRDRVIAWVDGMLWSNNVTVDDISADVYVHQDTVVAQVYIDGRITPHVADILHRARTALEQRLYCGGMRVYFTLAEYPTR